MKRFNKILEDIKEVKIQGAENIAKAGMKAFLLNPNKNSAKKILLTRPTEPLMQNSIKLLLKSKNQARQAKKILLYLKKSKSKISKAGSKLVKKDMNIYSHCHSSTVIDILKSAKKLGKDFVVYTTEVEPLLQGRKTALELNKSKIKVIVAPDLAAEQTLKKCDLLLFGADAFLKKGVVNKIGTSILCKIAKENHIPAYVCGVSLKFTKKIKMEIRKQNEVWQNNHKTIEVFNPAFDFVKKKLITGVISEFGILSYKEFIKLAKNNLKKF